MLTGGYSVTVCLLYRVHLYVSLSVMNQFSALFKNTLNYKLFSGMVCFIGLG